MKAKPLPSKDYLNECLEYFPLTGALVWRERPLHHFKDARSQSSWNGKNAGMEAFIHVEESGYLRGSIQGIKQLAHRIIWKMLHGTEPENIDHDDGIRTNNKEANLMASSKAENAHNKAMLSNNTSEVTGVTKAHNRDGWIIRLGDKYIGYRTTFEEAASLREEALSVDNSYSQRHGR